MEACSDVESDTEADASCDFDDDDCVNDPDYEVSREDVEHMERSISPDFLSCNVTGKLTEVERTGESTEEHEFEASPQPEPSSEAMVTEYAPTHHNQWKRQVGQIFHQMMVDFLVILVK
ncbi:hypothetical protein JTB14_010785 [Gonioctena quinquepunctata]|nr:hypothetical protein JTB14_010785 [Gonioctena quinquepunctata]